MKALLTIVGVLLGLLLLVGLALLVVPTRVSADGVFHEDRVDAWAEVRWAAGLLALYIHAPEGLVIRVLGREVRRIRPRKRAEREREDALQKEPAPRRRRQVRPRFLLRVVRRALRSLRVRGSLRGTFGTGDPAQTAWFAAALFGSRRLQSTLDTRELRLDWVEPRVELDGHVEGLVWPAELAWIVASEWWRSR